MKTNISNQFRAQALQDQFGLKIANRLSQASSEVPHDISERLRVARQQAVAQRKKPQLVLANHFNVQNGVATLHFGNERIGLWGRFASILPLIALLVGLIAINIIQDDDRANELAEVDSALLTDDLPPSAYTDPGFTQFLRVSKEQAQ
jgi:hypothetical protein